MRSDPVATANRSAQIAQERLAVAGSGLRAGCGPVADGPRLRVVFRHVLLQRARVRQPLETEDVAYDDAVAQPAG